MLDVEVIPHANDTLKIILGDQKNIDHPEIRHMFSRPIDGLQYDFEEEDYDEILKLEEYFPPGDFEDLFLSILKTIPHDVFIKSVEKIVRKVLPRCGYESDKFLAYASSSVFISFIIPIMRGDKPGNADMSTLTVCSVFSFLFDEFMDRRGIDSSRKKLFLKTSRDIILDSSSTGHKEDEVISNKVDEINNLLIKVIDSEETRQKTLECFDRNVMSSSQFVENLENKTFEEKLGIILESTEIKSEATYDYFFFMGYKNTDYKRSSDRYVSFWGQIIDDVLDIEEDFSDGVCKTIPLLLMEEGLTLDSLFLTFFFLDPGEGEHSEKIRIFFLLMFTAICANLDDSINLFSSSLLLRLNRFRYPGLKKFFDELVRFIVHVL